MAETKRTPKQMLLYDIACALTDNTADMYEAGHFVDLTTGEVTFIQGEYMLEDVTPEELAEYEDWEQEQIIQYAEHDLVKIHCLPSHESFRVMGILQDWYDFKNAAEETMAQKWLEEHNLNIIDGKIVRTKQKV